jgi:aminoglycoside phosphotransferase (APT) family kinase protein
MSAQRCGEQADRVDKASITADVAACLVRSQFPQWSDRAVVRVDLDGWDNTTFRLGDDLSVRMPSADGYVPQIDKEHRWLPVLAPHLSLDVPQPVTRGMPGCGYPRPWSVYRWLAGEPALAHRVADDVAFARALGAFLVALRGIDATGGPEAGAHSFFRGADLSTYDRDVRRSLAALHDVVDVDASRRVWDRALGSTWTSAPVWVHGDVTPSNLLVRDGHLAAVIDFGCCAIGDPSCDLVMRWTYFTGTSRAAFVDAVDLDEATWSRAAGWALWKALITIAQSPHDAPASAARWGWRIDPLGVVDEVLADA